MSMQMPSGCRHGERIHGKKRFIRKMYSALAGRYDRTNRVISFGRDRRWRKAAVANLPRHGRLADLGGGTGDLTLSYIRHRRPNADVVLVDFNREMLFEAGRKLRAAAPQNRVLLVLADVERLPFKSSCFTGAMSAFVLRNLPAVDGLAAESIRVLRAGERAVFLDVTRPAPGWFRRLFDMYFQRVMPRLAMIVNRRQEPAYRYLARSVVELPAGSQILETFRHAGFVDCRFQALSGGMATVFEVIKPQDDA